jgi:hypothetical protein
MFLKKFSEYFADLFLLILLKIFREIKLQLFDLKDIFAVQFSKLNIHFLILNNALYILIGTLSKHLRKRMLDA